MKDDVMKMTSRELKTSEVSLCGVLGLSAEDIASRIWRDDYKLQRTLNYLRRVVRTARKKDVSIESVFIILGSSIKLPWGEEVFLDYLKEESDYNKINSILLKIIQDFQN